MAYLTKRLTILATLLALSACGGAGSDSADDDEVGAACGGAQTETAGGEAGGAEVPDLDGSAEEIIERLKAIEAQALPDWEAATTEIVLDAYDADDSGSLETDAEVNAILCEVWRHINHEYGERTNSGQSVREAYGFAPTTFWLEFLGVERSQRENLRQSLLDCGIQ